jgi:4-hydroxy-tetrahydrodipicolinate reductase
MQIIIVGSGKLATELLNTLEFDHTCQVVSWTDKVHSNGKSIVVHAGSGRELKDVIAYCEQTRSPLVELSTGSEIENALPAFPVVLCPNTNILMLKFMNMLARGAHLFRGYSIKLTESHQAQKASVPGTAVSMASALGLNAGDVHSVRDPDKQKVALHIPVEHLNRHAYHQIVIEDAACSINLETRVYGASPYADGVARILAAIRSNELENRLYVIDEFVENGWI